MRWLIAGAAVAALLFWFLTQPVSLLPSDLPGHEPNPANGELVFHAGGCSSCHGQNLGGGLEMHSDFGTFRVPNISPDNATGIGLWTTADFVNAMMLGVSPGGKHYYPAFPYASYTRMRVQDVIDLHAYIESLPAVNSRAGQHSLAFPWNIRRGIGLWKMRYLNQSPVTRDESGDPVFERGRYLVEGPGHCGECHTPRDAFGGLRTEVWLAGAPNPDGEGKVPNITAHEDGLKSWSKSDIAYYLQSGFMPDFDTVGGSMVEVQENISHLPAEDHEAIAEYLKSIPIHPDTVD